MATSATPHTQTHPQIEYEQGFLLEDWAGAAKAYPPRDEEKNAGEHRKPSLREPRGPQLKSAAG